MKLNQILLILFVFSFLGYIFEAIVFNNFNPDTLSIKLGITLPFKFIYGGAVLLLILIDRWLPQYNALIKSLIATLIITFYECILGQISLYVNGYHTWDYSQNFYPMCNNYNSLSISTGWFFLIFIFYALFHYMFQFNEFGNIYKNQIN